MKGFVIQIKRSYEEIWYAVKATDAKDAENKISNYLSGQPTYEIFDVMEVVNNIELVAYKYYGD